MATIIKEMAKDLLVAPATLTRVIRSAPHRYKTYDIKKKNGRETRNIAHPSRELKKLQYWVLHNKLSDLPVHTAVTGYVKGKSIRDNALPHCANEYILKLDLRQFFPSIKSADFKTYATSKTDWHTADIDAMSNILFFKPELRNELVLSIGAPTSPTISNVIMHDLDVQINQYCSERDVVFTRYADDMTFSGNDHDQISSLVQFMNDLLSQTASPRLTLNNGKTILCSRANSRRITGVVITNDGRLSIGKKRKRLIRSMTHHFLNGKYSTEKEHDELIGWLSFSNAIEPEFVRKLEEFYHAENLKDAVVAKRKLTDGG